MPVPRKIFEKYINEYGWSVIPVRFMTDEKGKVNKIPRVTSWKEFMTRKPTEADLDAWFATSEPDGIGLVTGEVSGIVAVDIDSAENPIQISSALVSKSAFSGGRHYLYRWTEAIRNTVRIEGMPIDFRGDGGFVVLPPSEFMGKMYSWESLDFANLSYLPAEIKQMLTTERVKTKTYTYTGDQSNPLPDAYEGSRNHTAAQVAGLILADVKPRLWQTVAWHGFQEWNEKQCHPPLPDHELRSVWESIMRAEANTIVSEATEEVLDIPRPLKMTEVAKKRLVERELESEAPSTGYPELDTYIKGFIPGHVITFTGDTNVGKTTICCNFAHRVSKQGKKVLYFALEPENTIVDYLASVRTGRRFDQLTEVDLSYDDPNIDVYGKEQIGRVEDMIKVVDALPRYDLVIIDHIGYFTTGGLNLNNKQADVMKMLSALAKQKQTAILLVAHIRKRMNRGLQIHEDDISGSAAFKQDATEVLIVTRNSEEDEDRNTVYTDEGLISVRKTKTGGGQGSVKIHFKPGSALIQDAGDVAQELWS